MKHDDLIVSCTSFGVGAGVGAVAVAGAGAGAGAGGYKPLGPEPCAPIWNSPILNPEIHLNNVRT